MNYTSIVVKKYPRDNCELRMNLSEEANNDILHFTIADRLERCMSVKLDKSKKYMTHLVNECDILTNGLFLSARAVGKAGIVLTSVHLNAESETNVFVHGLGLVQVSGGRGRAACAREVVIAEAVKQLGGLLSDTGAEGGYFGHEAWVIAGEVVDENVGARGSNLVHALKAVHGASLIKGAAQGRGETRHKVGPGNRRTKGSRELFGDDSLETLSKLSLHSTEIQSLKADKH
jgi:hypothetical protein